MQAIPTQYFEWQRDTFDALLNLLHPFILRQNTTLRDCIPPEKLLALGLNYRFAHWNSYLTIGANFAVEKSTVIEAVQDVTEAPFTWNSFFGVLWHFGELQSLAILSGGIFEHLVHSAHFLNWLTNGSHQQILHDDRLFGKVNNFLC